MYQEGMKILGEESHSHASIQSKTFVQSWCSGSLNSYNNTSILVLYFCSKLPPIFFWITFVLKHSEKTCWELLRWSFCKPWWTPIFLLYFCSITSHFLLYTFYSETFRKILLRTLALKLMEPLVNSHVNFKRFQLEKIELGGIINVKEIITKESLDYYLVFSEHPRVLLNYHSEFSWYLKNNIVSNMYICNYLWC